MAGYDASVRFNSDGAERKVKDFARSIGNLRTNFKNAAAAGSTFGAGIKSATDGATRASTRVRALDRDLTKLGASSRRARADLISFGKSVDSASIGRASTSIDKMSRAFASLAQAAKRTESSMAGIVKSVTTLRERSGTAATAVGRLATVLGRLATAATRASRAVSGLSRSMSGMAGAGSASSASVGSAANASNRASAAASGLSRNSQRAASGMAGLGRASRDANESLLESAEVLIRFRNLASFLAAGFGVQALVEAADTYKLVSARLNIVATSTANLDFLQRRLIESSNATRTGYKENAALFTKLAMAGEAYGISQEQSLTVTENVAKALKISGATASESAAATQQLSQAFASGRIQGDELRSVLENSPRLAQALSTELADLGINLGNVRDKASEGKIGINELVRAFGSANITKQLAEEFELIPITIGDSLIVARNKFIEFVGELDKATGVSNGVVNTIVFLSNNLATLGTIAAFVAVSQIAKLVAGFFAARVAAVSAAAATAGLTGQLAVLGFTARAAGASLLAAFGGPIGVAVAGLTVIVGGLVSEVYESGRAFSDSAARADESSGSLARMEERARAAGISTQNLSGASDSAGGSFSLLGPILSATSKLYGELGNSAQFAAEQMLRAKIAEGKTRISEYQKSLDSTKPKVYNSKEGSLRYVIGSGVRKLVKSYRDNSGITENTQKALDAENTNVGNLERELQLLKILGPEKPRAIAAPATSSSGGSGGSKDKTPKDDTDQIRSAFQALEGQLDSTEAARQKFQSGIETLDSAMAKGLVTTERYKELAGKLAKDTFGGLSVQMKDLAKENANLEAELAGGDSYVARYQEGADIIKEQVSQIDAIIKKEGDKTGALTAQRAELIGQLDAYAGIVNRNKELVDLSAKRKREEEEITRLVDEASNKVFDLLTNRLRDSLSTSKNIFKSFFKDVFGFAKDLFSQVLGAYVFEPIRESFRKTLGSAFGSQAAKGGTNDATPAVGQGLVSKVKLEISDVISKTSNDNTKPSATDKQPTGNSDGKESDPIVVDGKQQQGFIPNLVRSYKSFGKEMTQDLGKIFKPVGKALKPVLEKLGINANTLGKVAGKALAGAQVGGAIADLGKLVGIKTSKTGGQVGGAIGGAIGGPLGSAIGGAVGAVVGGFFKKSKFATATVTGTRAENVSTGGNSATREKAATGVGGAIGKSVQSIADQLGGTVGDFKVSIGTLNDEFRVSSTGRTGKLKTKYADVKNFGKDGEEEAIAYAIQVAVQQGAIKGIRAATQRLLQASKDLEQGLKDAVDFENVFKTVEQRADPVKFAMKNLGKEFERLTELFKRAGASSEEFAVLGEFFKQETNAVLESVTDSLRKFRDDLIGGDSSFKSPTARLDIANAKFADLEGKIAAGQSVDQNVFTEAGQALQQLARQVYGSTPEFQAYQQRLLDATNKLIANAETEVSTMQPVVDAINNNGAKATDATNQTNNLLQQILANGGGFGGGADTDFSGGSLIYENRFAVKNF